MNKSLTPWLKSIACVLGLGAMGYWAAGAAIPQKDTPQPRSSKAPAPYFVDEAGRALQGSDWPVQFRTKIAINDYTAAVTAYRTAQEGSEKETKKAELKKKLTDIFEADMKARKAQADEIETRLKKLQDQYKAREAAKDSIIDLQIQVLEKDADGLGFPKSSETTSNTESSRNRLSPLLGQSAVEMPALLRGAESREVSLDELLKTKPSLVESLKKKNHFVVSQDGKMYAYVGQSHPQAPSIVQVRDSEVGRVLATYQARGVIAEIRFQEGGVGVRLPDGKFELPIPLSPPGNVFRNPEMGSPDGNIGERYRPLDELKKVEPALVKKLTDEFLFVESADGKYHSFANVNYPNGPSYVHLIDSATGKLLGRFTAKEVVTAVNLRKEGVLVSEKNGPLLLRIPLSGGVNNSAADQMNSAANRGSNQVVSNIVSGINGNPERSLPPSGDQMEEYKKIRKEILEVKRVQNLANEELRKRLEEAKAANPAVSEGELKAIEASSANYRRSVESRLHESEKILVTKLKLLTLDVESATATLRVAEAEHVNGVETNKAKPGARSASEIRRLQAEFEKAKIELERAVTIRDLFESIKAEVNEAK